MTPSRPRSASGPATMAVVPREPVPRPLFERAAELGQQFLLPLAEGRPVTVGRPVGPVLAAEIARAWPQLASGPQALPQAAELQSARLGRLSALLCEAPPFEAAPEDVVLALALHDLCFLGHPLAWSSVFGAGRRARLVDTLQSTLELCGPPRTALEALSRHALLADLFRLRRVDTTVRWWSGHQHFRGQPVPRRLRLWPRLRRVREDVERIDPLAEAAQTDPGLVRHLVERTPLTDLLEPLREAPPLRLRPVHRVVLQSAPLARLVAHSLCERGLERAGAPWVAALRRLLAGHPDAAGRRLARLAVSLLCHAHLLCALEPEPRRGGDASTLGRAETLASESQERAAAVRELFGLFAEAYERRRQLGFPPPDPRVLPAWESYAARARALAGPGRPLWPELDRL